VRELIPRGQDAEYEVSASHFVTACNKGCSIKKTWNKTPGALFNIIHAKNSIMMTS
jgi:hypothetical protein